MESLGTEISWPSGKPQEKQSRIHNHHISLRSRIKELQSRSYGKQHAKGEAHETTKAAAWAVFQHHGGGGVGVGVGHTHGLPVRRPTRFKIEAEMKHGSSHRSVSEIITPNCDAGSTLFDSFELDSLLKTLDHAVFSATISERKVHAGDEAEESPSEMRPSKAQGEGQLQRTVRDNIPARNVVHSDKNGHGDAEEDSITPFGHTPNPLNVRRHAPRRSLDSSIKEKDARGDSQRHHHPRWKNLLHTLHLDGATNGLLHAFQKSHAQVAPHDSPRGRGRKSSDYENGSQSPLTSKKFDAHFHRNAIPVSKDVDPPSAKDHHQPRYRHHPHFWKLGFKAVLSAPFCRPEHILSENEESDREEAHKSYNLNHQTPKQAYTSPNPRHHELGHHTPSKHDLIHNSEQIQHHEHHHHYEQHHHHQHVYLQGEHPDLTIQAMSKRFSNPTSFEEKVKSGHANAGSNHKGSFLYILQ